MKINIEKVCELYGKDILELIKSNIEKVMNNINYLKVKKLENVEEIFERNCLIFLQDENVFAHKFDYLYKKYGRELDDNIELWEEIQ